MAYSKNLYIVNDTLKNCSNIMDSKKERETERKREREKREREKRERERRTREGT